MREPVSEKNISGYGLSTIPWERAREHLENDQGMETRHWLATVRPDGRPHVAGVGAVWLDDTFYFVSGSATRKSLNLADNSHCVIGVAAQGIDLVVEGEAVQVRDDSRLQRIAEFYASQGWNPTVRDGAFYAEYSAPSAGPPPWDVYEVVPTTVFGVGSADPPGATRWRF
ncbi:MAG: pyridoxamine 5'-phosphate oxidase family protein [Dehalococcoidia bacterium]